MLSVLFLLCACTKEPKEEITFSSWGSVTEVEILNKVISDFEKNNPDIKINFIHIPQNYFQKIHLLFVSNTEPDVIFINNLYLPLYAQELTDLSKIINKAEFFEKGLEALTIDGKLLAAPRDISNLVVYYNKDYVKTKPKNFNEFYSEIKKTTQKGRFGISFERDIFYAEPFMLTLGNDKGLEFYKNLEGLYAPKPSDVGSSTLAQMFLDKKLAFYVSGRWMYPKLKETAKFNFGVMNFNGEIYADASGWAIAKNTTHFEAAEKFIKFLSSKDNIDYFVSTGLIVPARKDSAKALDNNDERAFLTAIQTSKSRNPNKNYSKERDKLNRQIFEK